MDSPQKHDSDLFKADRRKTERENPTDRRLYKRPSGKLRTYGIIGAILFAVAIVTIFVYVLN